MDSPGVVDVVAEDEAEDDVAEFSREGREAGAALVGVYWGWFRTGVGEALGGGTVHVGDVLVWSVGAIAREYGLVCCCRYCCERVDGQWKRDGWRSLHACRCCTRRPLLV